ncbi:hypothetical protein N0B31_02145 [Salinirubellus salinus]|uniref:Uncharacterized protein n=1 Tax=Salinirubellus salinus TaxID=1364945 RepID=A0A9E7R401_9EURY|nr:hypothetical protein [Salinirubellus salinus]UWM55091.1 hypothetical protein N0B31_02145 [Salinirubellus salinus]
MEEARVRKLRFVALQVVGAAAVVHLVVGATELLRIANAGLLGPYLTNFVTADPRPLLFLVSGLAIVAGIVAVARGYVDYRTGYRLGLLVLGVYVLSWVGWHTVLDHGLALGGDTPTTPDTHNHEGLLGTLQSHYVDPLVAAVTASTEGTPGTGRVLLGVVSISLELVGMALLGLLLRVDPAAAVEGERNPFRRFDAEEADDPDHADSDAD